MMRVRVLQHVPFEDIGSIRGWLDRRGAEVRYTRFFAADDPPQTVDDIDLLIAMGGPMSVNDEAACPWLIAEKALLRKAIGQQVPVLGICLGAQLVASALGARVYPNQVKEIGWFPVHAVPAPTGTFRFPADAVVFHWHGETFELPDSAVCLAASAACEIQAFQVGRSVIGLQFHPEMTLSGASLLTEHCSAELVPAPYIQDERALLRSDAATYAISHALMDDILDYLVEAAAVHGLPFSDARGSAT